MPETFEQFNPYRSLLLAQVNASATLGPLVNGVLDDVEALVDASEKRTLGPRLEDAAQGRLRIGSLRYIEQATPGWSDGSIVDTLNQLVVVCRLKRFIAIYASDGRFRSQIVRAFDDDARPSLSKLECISRDRLNGAFVNGNMRTLWLSGTHTRTTVKPDSKILAGLDLLDSLDPLDDQTYYFSAARSVPEQLGVTIGVSPSKSAVWAGASQNWLEFTQGVLNILRVLDNTTEEISRPLPVLAHHILEIDEVKEPFDISIQPPELVADPMLSDKERERLERWAYGSNFVIDDTGSPIKAQMFLDEALLGTVELALDFSDPKRVICAADGVAVNESLADRHKEGLHLLGGWRNLRVRFESGHTLSGGTVFEQRFRDLPFSSYDFVDFAGFNLTKEKPDPITAVGNGQDSLFDWTHAYWPNVDGTTSLPGGLLVSDDGSMEIADFIHLDNTGDVPVLSLIHVKAAGSDSPNRDVSVSSYEVVVGQAIKNLRAFDRLVLAEGLVKGLSHKISSVAFKDRAPSTRENFINELEKIGASYKRRLVIVQPHVREKSVDDARKKPDSSAAARLRQLDTLLLSAEAQARALGANFTVVTAKG